MRKLKSPDRDSIHVALLDGSAIVIGPDGRDVPDKFVQEAFVQGAIPAEDVVQTKRSRGRNGAVDDPGAEDVVQE